MVPECSTQVREIIVPVDRMFRAEQQGCNFVQICAQHLNRSIIVAMEINNIIRLVQVFDCSSTVIDFHVKHFTVAPFPKQALSAQCIVAR